MKSRILIIGQGIAGSLLAKALEVRGCEVVVVDNHHHWSSSIISAGLINPVTGKRLVLTPQFDQFFKHARKTYQCLSEEFHQDFLKEKPVRRIFQSQEEREQFLLKKDMDIVLQGVYESGYLGKFIEDPFGSVEFSCGGVCQGSIILKSLRNYFKSKGMLEEEAFKYDEIIEEEQCISWRGRVFDYIIFCEGFQAVGNKWFNSLPFNNVKGEILHIRPQETWPDVILAQTKWCAPLGDGNWMAGATYDRTSVDCRISAQGQHDIVEGLKRFIKSSFVVTDHVGAIRPVIFDQMPVIGIHPVYESIGIFNGLGSKGFLMAPRYADIFAEYLTKGESLPQEVDVRRFKQI